MKYQPITLTGEKVVLTNRPRSISLAIERAWDWYHNRFIKRREVHDRFWPNKKELEIALTNMLLAFPASIVLAIEIEGNNPFGLLYVQGENLMIITDGSTEKVGDEEKYIYWGKGYGKDAINTFLAWYFPVMGRTRISAWYPRRNVVINGLLAKIGFRREGCARESITYKGVPKDVIMAGLLEREWVAVQDGTADRLTPERSECADEEYSDSNPVAVEAVIEEQ